VQHGIPRLIVGYLFLLQVNFDKRGSFKREKAYKRGWFSVRSDPFRRQNVQRLAELSCERELDACFLPLAYRCFDCRSYGHLNRITELLCLDVQ
jgi:hypothetical protein